MCEHVWKPVPTWGGRYRCDLCAAFGYRGHAILDPCYPEMRFRKASQIYHYVCGTRECDAAAVGKHKGRWFCPKHRPKARRLS